MISITKKIYHSFGKPLKVILEIFGIVHLTKKIVVLCKYRLARSITLKNLYGIKISFKNDDTFEFRVNYLPDILNNSFETQTLKLFIDVIKENDTVIDCGSNFGLFSLLACHLTGPNGCVYAFDASKKTCDSLRESKKINYFSNLIINNYALSNISNKKIKFYGNTGGGTIIKDNPLYDTNDSLEEVSTISLDNYFKGKKIKNLKLIKIDVEGSEYFVLRGMKKLISQNPNTIITFELTKRSMLPAGYSINDIVIELKNLNMSEVFDITHHDLIKKIDFNDVISLFENNEIGSYTSNNGLLVELMVMNNVTKKLYNFA